MENASYGLTVCAERVAIYSAVAGGDTEISAMAVCWCVPLQHHTYGVPSQCHIYDVSLKCQAYGVSLQCYT